jgi:hypothetical protein
VAPAQAEAGSGEPHGQDGSRERSRPYGRIANGPGLSDWVIKRLLCSGRIRTARPDRDGRPLMQSPLLESLPTDDRTRILDSARSSAADLDSNRRSAQCP